MNKMMEKIKQILKNKRVRIGILVPVIAVVCGFSAWAITDTVIENFAVDSLFGKVMVDNLESKQEIVSETKIQEEPQEEEINSASVQNTNGGDALVTDKVVQPADDLTAEDKALKAEIQAVSDTKVDFRHKKTEKVGAKTHNLTYSAIKGNGTFEDTDMITYQNEAGEKFFYHLKTGKLISAVIDSLKTEKRAQSISLDEAEKIAYAYAKDHCDIATHKLDIKKTLEDCYQFSYYAGPIAGYESSDTLHIRVGFDGNIVQVMNYTVGFDYVEVLIDEEKVQKKLADGLKNYAEGSYYETTRVIIKNGKAYMTTRIYDAKEGELDNMIGFLDLDYRLKQPSENGDAVIQ